MSIHASDYDFHLDWVRCGCSAKTRRWQHCLYFTVLHCTVLYSTVLYCTELFVRQYHCARWKKCEPSGDTKDTLYAILRQSLMLHVSCILPWTYTINITHCRLLLRSRLGLRKMITFRRKERGGMGWEEFHFNNDLLFIHLLHFISYHSTVWFHSLVLFHRMHDSPLECALTA